MFIQNMSSMMVQPSRVASDNPSRPVSDSAPSTGLTPGTTTDAPVVKLVESSKPAAQQPSDAQLKEALDSINKSLKQSNINLQFNIDAESKRSVVKLVDGETGDVIRQFPSEDALAISRSIDRIQQGMLLKQKA